MASLWVGTTTVVEISSLKNAGVSTEDASVNVTGISELVSGEAISPDIFPVSAIWSASSSAYLATLPHTLSLTSGEGYKVNIVADDSGTIRTWSITAVAESS